MTVDVSLAAEGPQRDALDPDIAAALAKEPKAAAFFDGLAQFYRKGVPDLDRRHQDAPRGAQAPHRRGREAAQGRGEGAPALNVNPNG